MQLMEEKNFDTEPSSSITLATSVPPIGGTVCKTSRSRTRAILWTLYNYEQYLEQLRAFARHQTRYTVFGYEVCPTTQRPHLQGYFYFENPRAYPNKIIRELFRGIHDTSANGTPQHNRDYCLKLRTGDKPNERFEEFGEIPKQGDRTDWQRAVSDLSNGVDIVSVVTEQPQLLPAIRALQTFKNLTMKSTHRDVKVIFIVGNSGTGKTRWAWENYPDLYSKPEGHWWDGYTDQKTILLDDYYGDIPYSQFLKVLDRYPLNLPIKGGFVAAAYDTIIITSNKSFTQWYPEPNNAIKRRIHEIKNFDIDITDASQTLNEEETCIHQKRCLPSSSYSS